MKNTANVKTSIKLSLVDRAIGAVSPNALVKRVKSRLTLATLTASGFVTPQSVKRSMRGWFPAFGSADADTLPSLDSSRAGSRDLYMNTPVAIAAIRRMRTNVIGAGLSFQSRINRDVLGLDGDAADVWEKNTEAEFRLWCSSKNCDVTRTQNFFQLQQLSFLSYLLSGDVVTLLPSKRVKGFPYSLRIQIIEGDRLSNPSNVANLNYGGKIAGGIEIDNYGAPLAYHIRSKHPGDKSVEAKWIRVPAYGSRSGRRNVIHVYDKERPGQRRGMPFLAPVLEQLKQLTRFSEAELMAALVTAFFTVFVKTEEGSANPLAAGFVPETETVSNGDTDEDEVYEMGNGNIISLNERESIDIADPKRPNAAFEPFFNAIVSEVGASLEIPFEQLVMKFNSNYSASRAAILEGWKTFRMRRTNFIADFNDPIYEEWLTEAILKGRIVAEGFFTDPLRRSAWLGSRWEGPGQGQIDPLKETNASLARIKGRLSTYEDESNILGKHDWESAMSRLAREESFLEKNNLNVLEQEPSNQQELPTDDNE